MEKMTSTDYIRAGFWGAAGAAAFSGLLYLAFAGIGMLASKPKTANTATARAAGAKSGGCGCGCGG